MLDGWARNPVTGGDGVVAGSWSGDAPVDNNDFVLDDNGDDEAVNASIVSMSATVGPVAIAGDDIDVIRHFSVRSSAYRIV